jgi:hypothetical protein
MDGITREHLAVRRTIFIVASVLLAAATFVVRMPGSIAAVNSCRARDVTQNTAWDSNLQAVIRAASRGDVIAVKFVCVGNFKIAKPLTLIGKPTADLPKAVLNGNGQGQVLVVSRGNVTLENLKITNGSAPGWHYGGGITTAAELQLNDTVVKGNTGAGIYNTGILTLNGSSLVSHNTTAGIHSEYDPTVKGSSVTLNGTSSVAANTGSGIYSYYATTTLNDASSVTRNSTDGGHSVLNWDAVFIMNASASVSDNVGASSAIGNYGSFVMNGSSTVSGNIATTTWGGGVYNASIANMTMNDSSSVVGNSSVRSGGGIQTDGMLTMNGSSFVTGNTADADDNGVGGGGGIKVPCSGTLIGAVDGGNVNDNYRGTASPVENNIAGPTCP